MEVSPVPKLFHSVTPYLHVEDVQNLIGFLIHAFGAKQLNNTSLPDGTIINARLLIGNSVIEMSEVRGSFKPMPCALHLYVDDADELYNKAVELGAVSVMEPSDQFYGDREAFIIDPCGNHWYIATHKEVVSNEEMKKRMNEFFVRMNEEDKQDV
jgi:PhnB protein